MTRFRAVRAIHEWSGLVLAALVLLYAVSGFVMVRGEHFPNRKTIEERAVPHGADASALGDEGVARATADRLRAELGLRGRARAPRRDGETWVFEYRRPGTESQLELAPGDPTARVVVRRQGFATLMRQIHGLHGYGGGIAYFAWALALDAVALAMVAFALSGACLWYVQRRDRLGWLLLVGSTAYTLGSVVYLLVRA